MRASGESSAGVEANSVLRVQDMLSMAFILVELVAVEDNLEQT